MRIIIRRYSRGLAALLTAVATTGFALAQQATTVGTLDGHTDPVYAIAWSPDGKMLATAGFDNTVRLWDAATRKEIKKYDGHTKLVLAVAISPDGKHIVSGSQDNTAKIWDVPTSGPVEDVRRSFRRRRGPGRQARRQAVCRGVGQVGQGLGRGHRGRGQGTDGSRRRRGERRLAR